MFFRQSNNKTVFAVDEKVTNGNKEPAKLKVYTRHTNELKSELKPFTKETVRQLILLVAIDRRKNAKNESTRDHSTIRIFRFLISFICRV